MASTTQITDFAKGVAENATWEGIKWLAGALVLPLIGGLLFRKFRRPSRPLRPGGKPYDLKPSVTEQQTDAFKRYEEALANWNKFRARMEQYRIGVQFAFIFLGWLFVVGAVLWRLISNPPVAETIALWLIYAEVTAIWMWAHSDERWKNKRWKSWSVRKRRVISILGFVWMILVMLVTVYFLMPHVIKPFVDWRYPNGPPG